MKKLSLVFMLMMFNSYAEEIPGETLLSHFSGSCDSSGEWTQAALAQSAGLVTSINAMRNDTDCSSTVSAISQLNNLSAQLTVLNKVNTSEKSLANYNASEQELLIQLTKTTNPVAIEAINDKLREVQLNRAVLLNGDKSSNEIAHSDLAIVMGQIAQSANASFAQIASSQKCLEKHPGLLQTATSIMAGVGSAVALVNPAIGVTMTATASFINVSMDGIKRNRSARQIRKITDNATTYEAYRCALESMSNRWCQMKDAKAFIKFKDDNRDIVFENTKLSQAITLNDREIPTILEWLNKIRNGATSTNTADSSRRGMVLARELIVRNRKDNGLSLIYQKRQAYNDLAGRPKEQWDFLSSIILELAPPPNPYGNNSNIKDPLSDIYSPMYAPYYLISLGKEDPTIRSNGSYIFFADWSKPDTKLVTLDEVEANYRNWIRDAENLINRELSDAQQPDPSFIFNLANVESEPFMITPLDALKTVADFLEHHPSQTPNRDFSKIYKDTIRKLRKIHDITIVAIATEDMRPIQVEDKKLTPIEQIYEIAQLKYGTVVFQARLEMIIRLSLLEYIKKSPEKDQIVLAQLLATDRFYATISSMNGNQRYAKLDEDLDSGMAYTLKNLSGFMDIYGFNINRTLGNLYAEESQVSRTMAETNRNMRRKLCFVALAAENVDRYIKLDYCKGLQFETSDPEGPKSIIIGEDTFKLDLTDRACVYREFLRQKDIYKKWRIKN